MCGIVGYTGKNDAESVLLKGLSCLQYRGYDSAGIAVQGENGRIAVIRAEGKLQQLVQKVEAQAPLCGTCGIGHTRWATCTAPRAASYATPTASASPTAWVWWTAQKTR